MITQLSNLKHIHVCVYACVCVYMSDMHMYVCVYVCLCEYVY